MTDRPAAAATQKPAAADQPRIAYLIRLLGEVEKASLLEKGEAVARLAAAVIVLLREFEQRIRALEGDCKLHGENDGKD